jgi:hypothetical protein
MILTEGDILAIMIALGGLTILTLHAIFSIRKLEIENNKLREQIKSK